MLKRALLPSLLLMAFAAPAAHASVDLIAIGSLTGSSAGAYADLSGLTGTLENGVAANVLGGLGSGLAYAGGNTFIALPDRGPNATSYSGGSAVDNTTSYIARLQTVSMDLAATPSGSLSYTLTPTLTSTTLLWSSTPLNYGTTAGLPSAVPSINTADRYYFTGRSDNFIAGLSSNPNDARLDPESIRVSNDGKSVFISDEYGPYVYQFDRATGERTRTFALPGNLAVSNLSSQGSVEISGNTSGRVANKGMEGLALTPDGKTLVGFMQSPLIQDGGDGGRANRIVTIDIASGATHEYAYDNKIGSKNYNSSEIVAVNDHQFLVEERDGKGLGDGSNATVKQLYMVDISGATDVTGISGEANLLATIQPSNTKTLWLDIRAALNANGITDDKIPAKLEGVTFGQDIVVNGVTKHTLYIANDNDFVPGVAGPNNFYVFSFTDADLAGYVAQPVPEPESYALMLGGLGLLGFMAKRRRR